MRPSQYNYLKRTFTRSMAKQNNFSILSLIFFPFRFCIFIVVCLMYVGILVLFYGSKIILKILFKFLKFFFSFLKNFFIGLFIFIKNFYKKNYYKKPKEKKEEKIIKYVNKQKEINITDIMKEFNISSSEAVKIVSKIPSNK